MSSPFSDQKQN